MEAQAFEEYAVGHLQTLLACCNFCAAALAMLAHLGSFALLLHLCQPHVACPELRRQLYNAFPILIPVPVPRLDLQMLPALRRKAIALRHAVRS